MELMELFRDQFGLYDQRILTRVMRLAQVRELKKGSQVYGQGETPGELVFLLDGLLRGYFLDAGGRDITDCLIFEPGAPAVASLEMGEPTAVYMEALTDSMVATLPLEEVIALLEEYPALYRLYTRMLIQALRRHWEVKAAMYQYTAMERYQWFLRTYPGLEDRMSGKHIASFLGMTQVTLSRLRRALREAGRMGISRES